MSDDEDSRLVIDDAATTPTTTPSLPPLAAAAAPQPAASSAAISPVLAPKDSNGTVAPPSSVASASTASESVKEEGELEEDDDAEARSSKTANASTAPDEKSPPKASPSETVDEKKELSVETTLPVKASPTSLISPGRTPATKVSPGRSRARQLDVPLNGEAMSPRARIGVVRKRKDSGSDEKRDGKSPAKKTSRVDKATCVKWTQCGGSEEEEESFFDLRTGAQALLDVTVMCKTDSHTMYIVAKWRGEELTGVITDGQPPAFHSYMKKRTMNGSSSSTESGEKAPSGSSTPSKGRTKEKEKEKEKRAGRSSSVSEGKAQKRLLAAATSAMSSKSEAGGDTPDEDWDPVTPRTPLRLVEVASALSLHECPREECGHKYERASELQFHLATMHCKKVVMKESLGSQTDLSGLSSVSVATDVDDLNKTIKLTPLEEESLQGLFKTARKAEKQDGGRASHYSDISDDGAPQLQKEEPPEQPSAFSEASQTIKTEVKKEQCLPLASASPAALPSSFQPPAEKPRPSISAVAPHVNSGFLPSRGLGEGSLLPPSAFGLAGTSYPYLLPGAPPFQRPPVAAGVASPVARPPGADERHKIHELKTIAKSEGECVEFSSPSVPSSSSSTTVDTKCLPSPAHSMQQRMGLSLMHPALQQQQQAQAQAQAQAAQQQQQMQQQHVQQQMQQMQLMQQLMRGSIPGIQSPEMLMLMMQQNQHMFPK